MGSCGLVHHVRTAKLVVYDAVKAIFKSSCKTKVRRPASIPPAAATKQVVRHVLVNPTLLSAILEVTINLHKALAQAVAVLQKIQSAQP